MQREAPRYRAAAGAREQFDVVVVGARCAGAPLATLLAREGIRVALVEKAKFPRDTLSTHIFQADALSFLDRLGITEQLRRTGAPLMNRADNRTEDLHWNVRWPTRPGDPGGLASVRRFVLDPILARTAERAGADVRMATKATGLVRERGRVAGVRAVDEAGPSELRARLVVGADGRNSTIAQLTGARKYNVTQNQHALYWGFFEGARIGEPTFVFHRWGNRIVVACPSDSGLYQVQVFIEPRDLDRFRSDLEAHFMDRALSCKPVANVLSGASRVGKLLGIVRWEGFFRDASGPGWVLTGDAGHFKDPAPGRGIGDAFLQTDRLAPAIASALNGPDCAVDDVVSEWGHWRDQEFAEHYWFAQDLGASRPLPAVLLEVLRSLHREGDASSALDISNHRLKPSQLLTPPRVLRATGRLVVHRRGHRLEVLREVGELVAQELHRRRLARRPEYIIDGHSHADAGPIEVKDSDGDPRPSPAPASG